MKCLPALLQTLENAVHIAGIASRFEIVRFLIAVGCEAEDSLQRQINAKGLRFVSIPLRAAINEGKRQLGQCS